MILYLNFTDTKWVKPWAKYNPNSYRVASTFQAIAIFAFTNLNSIKVCRYYWKLLY